MVIAQYRAGVVPPPENRVIAAALHFAASRHAVPLELLQSFAYHVSGYNPVASSGGRLGLMMLTPAAAKRAQCDPLNPATAAAAVALYLRQGHQQCRGSWAHPLASYAWDQERGAEYVVANMEPSKWPAEVLRFVGRVLSGAGHELPFEVPLIIAGPR